MKATRRVSVMPGAQLGAGRRRILALAGLIVIVGGVLGVLALAGLIGNQGGGAGIQSVALLDTPPASERPNLAIAAEAGKLAPDFEISGYDGGRHRLSDFRGKPVYVNFWATWCLPCQLELPDIQELQSRHGDDLVVITVNRREQLNRAERYFERLPRKDGGTGVSFTVNGLDPDDTLYAEYRGLGMPVSVFIDPEGVVTRVVNGVILLDDMEQLLAEATG
jgi:thiol-disulfide isomerase/thioredoxin